MLQWKSKCSKAQSGVPGAGYGLFLKSHEGIPKGAHFCLYSNSSTTSKAMENSGVSKIYAVLTGKVWFGNNLGRFANKPGVVIDDFVHMNQLSAKAKPQMTEDDGKIIEKHLDSKCNAELCHMIS